MTGDVAYKHWSKQQIKLFVKDVRKRVGNGWRWLTPAVQKALIAEKALGIINMQARDTIETGAVSELWFNMLVEAQLDAVE